MFGESLADALDELAPEEEDEVDRVLITQNWSATVPVNCLLNWTRTEKRIVVAGSDQARVLGLGELVRRQLLRGNFNATLSGPAPSSEGRPSDSPSRPSEVRRWLSGVSIEVAGAVIGTGIIGVIVWTASR